MYFFYKIAQLVIFTHDWQLRVFRCVFEYKIFDLIGQRALRDIILQTLIKASFITLESSWKTAISCHGNGLFVILSLCVLFFN